ncbi:MAG: MFS transporter [Chloroflexota bacterium]|nr:MFS transporter [Chloroflexota bacterium]
MYPLRTSHRLLVTIFITQSLMSASQIAILTLHSIAAGILGGGDSTAGMPTTVVTFSHSIMAYAFGLYMGRFGRRLGISTAYAFGALGGVLGTIAVLNGSFALLLVSSACMGSARAGAQMSRFVVGEMFPAEKRAQMIGRIVFAGTIGAIFGPGLIEPGTQLAGTLALDLANGPALANSALAAGFMPAADFRGGLTTGPWVMASLMYGLSFLISILFLRPEPALVARQYASQSKHQAQVDTQHKLMDLLRLPNVQLAILSMLICQTVMSTLMTITPWHMHRADHSNATVSLVISAHVLGMFGLSAVTGYLIDRYGRIPMMVVAALTLVASAIIAPLSTQLPYLLLGLFLLGLGWNFGYIAGSSMLADALSGSDRTRVAGFNDMLVAFCAGLGTLSSGFLYGLGGFLLVSIGGGALALLLLALVRQLSVKQFALGAS